MSGKEPHYKDIIDTSRLRNMTGNDTFYARDLFEPRLRTFYFIEEPDESDFFDIDYLKKSACDSVYSRDLTQYMPVEMGNQELEPTDGY